MHSTACLVSITTSAPVPVPSCETRRSSELPKGRVLAMIIPHRRLSPAALRGVIEAFITREGTDYGLHEVPLATKVARSGTSLTRALRSSSMTPTPTVARYSLQTSSRSLPDRRSWYPHRAAPARVHHGQGMEGQPGVAKVVCGTHAGLCLADRRATITPCSEACVVSRRRTTLQGCRVLPGTAPCIEDAPQAWWPGDDCAADAPAPVARRAEPTP